MDFNPFATEDVAKSEKGEDEEDNVEEGGEELTTD